MNSFLCIFSGLCLKVLGEHFFICSDGKYVVHGLSKIIQDYVNNKINN